VTGYCLDGPSSFPDRKFSFHRHVLTGSGALPSILSSVYRRLIAAEYNGRNMKLTSYMSAWNVCSSTFLHLYDVMLRRRSEEPG
jgi:hypothetical protein